MGATEGGKFAAHKLTLHSSRLLGGHKTEGRVNTLSGWASTPKSDGLTVWDLRELVAKLDAIGAPDRARVDARKSDTGRLVQLAVAWEQRLTLAEMIAWLTQIEEDEREPAATDGDAGTDAAEPGGVDPEAEQGAG